MIIHLQEQLFIHLHRYIHLLTILNNLHITLNFLGSHHRTQEDYRHGKDEKATTTMNMEHRTSSATWCKMKMKV
ncbi:hypothetical protein B566_EDAN016057 [Ephemera danica]|nr:hypothetical protein B566_EDAN016057 [Ephemera danica]